MLLPHGSSFEIETENQYYSRLSGVLQLAVPGISSRVASVHVRLPGGRIISCDGDAYGVAAQAGDIFGPPVQHDSVSAVSASALTSRKTHRTTHARTHTPTVVTSDYIIPTPATTLTTMMLRSTRRAFATKLNSNLLCQRASSTRAHTRANICWMLCMRTRICGGSCGAVLMTFGELMLGETGGG